MSFTLPASRLGVCAASQAATNNTRGDRRLVGRSLTAGVQVGFERRVRQTHYQPQCVQRRLQCVCKSRRLEWGGARLHQSQKPLKSPPTLPASVEEMVQDASKSISSLGNFRKEIRVDFPLPYSEDWIQWDAITLPVAEKLTKLLRVELESLYGIGNVWISEPSTAMNRFPHTYECLPSLAAAKRSKIIVVVCPTCEELFFLEQLKNKTGPRTPIVVVNPRWLETDFVGPLSRMPYFLWKTIGSKFQEDSVAYCLTEEIVPQSSISNFMGSLGVRQGCKTVLLKRYNSPWALFTAGLDGTYHFTESFVQHPNGDMLRSAAKDEVCAVESPFLKMANVNPQDSTGSTASGTDSWLVPASPHRGHRN